MVLGLISTKRAALEPEAAVKERIRSAARYVPLSRLGLSTQCGFASSLLGNRISFAAQRQKLEAVARIAREVWG